MEISKLQLRWCFKGKHDSQTVLRSISAMKNTSNEISRLYRTAGGPFRILCRIIFSLHPAVSAPSSEARFLYRVHKSGECPQPGGGGGDLLQHPLPMQRIWLIPRRGIDFELFFVPLPFRYIPIGFWPWLVGNVRAALVEVEPPERLNVSWVRSRFLLDFPALKKLRWLRGGAISPDRSFQRSLRGFLDSVLRRSPCQHQAEAPHARSERHYLFRGVSLYVPSRPKGRVSRRVE